MADDEGKSASKGSKFLKKSKWGKIFKEDDSSTPQRQGTFKLNDDVVDFLKPSTDKQKPKLDIAIAKRWPDAHEVRTATAGPGSPGEAPLQEFRYSRPKRRKGLTVGFARTAPEIIGEGGEEAFQPTSEISRKRAMLARSISDKNPGVLADGRPWPGSPPAVSGQGRPSQQAPEEDDFVAPPLRRAQTSHNEVSPAVQAKMTSSPPPAQQEQQHVGPSRSASSHNARQGGRPNLQITPMGRPGIVVDTVQDSEQGSKRLSTNADPDYNDIIQDPSFVSQAPYARGGVKKYLGLAPDNTASPVYRKSRDMSFSEGMAFRRASSMIFKDEDEDNDTAKMNTVKPSFQQQQQQQQQLQHQQQNQHQQQAPPRLPEFSASIPNEITFDMPSPSEYSLTPPNAVSPSGPSPFEDPKYMKRHSRDVTPDPTYTAPQVQSSAQIQRSDPSPFDDPRYLKNFSRAGAQPPSQLSQAPDPQLRSQQRPPQSYFPTQSRTGPPQPAPPRISPQPPNLSQPQRPPRMDSGPGIVVAAAAAAAAQTAYQQNPYGPSTLQQPRQSQRNPRIEAQSAQARAEYAPPPPPDQYRPGPPQISLGSLEAQRQPVTVDAETAASRRNMQRPEGSAMPYRQQPLHTNPQTSAAAPGASAGASVPTSRQFPQDTANSRDRALPLANKPNGQPAQANLMPSNAQSRNAPPHSNVPSQLLPSGRSFAQGPPSPRFMDQASLQTVQSSSPQSLIPDQSKSNTSSVSPSARGSPADYFNPSRGPPAQPGRPPVGYLRQEGNTRPESVGSAHDIAQSSPSPQGVLSPLPPPESSPAADAAFQDFARRVAHMRGVFRLTAEKEQPADRCTPSSWARVALWWFLRGKAGLELLVQQRRSQPTGEPPREALVQAHVDVAKAWWIVTDALERYGPRDESTSPEPNAEAVVRQTVTMLFAHLKSISLSMGRTGLMPPTDSLIQGQDTRIWLEYPHFAPDAVAILGGSVGKSLIIDPATQTVDSYDMIPLSDTRDSFCYGRFRVDAYLETDEAETGRIALPCMLTIMRSKREYQTTIVLASQSELINIKVGPRQAEQRGITWQDVSWKASAFAFVIRLPRSFDLSIRMQERDFRAAWNLIEFARKVDHSLRADPDETLVHEVRLAELQYADSSNTNTFPSDKVRGCKAIVFERSMPYTDGSGTRKMHRGYRLLLITDAAHKTLSNVNHDVCRNAPLLFEFLTDSAAASGSVAMVIRAQEETRQCRMLLVFFDAGSRQSLYDVLVGLTVSQNETIIGKMTLASYNIEAATQTEGFTAVPHPALQPLQWQKLGVTNARSNDPNSRLPSTVESENLRVVARHSYGCITDRLNLGKGEMLLRLPCTDKAVLQILRQPQDDLSMSVDIRHAPQVVTEGTSPLLHLAMHQSTIRTLTFATHADLHNFQVCITGFSVRYDGLASSFGISRRRMVVPIYKKWEASRVRLQVVARDSVVQVLAFMEDFSHADALCFQVKSTDNFERIKGDSRSKKWAVRMVDAKFSLPKQEKGEVEGAEKVRRRFANLEGLEYAEEHDDITVGFETEEDRDRFAQALPAATSVARGITLKRRI